MSRLYLAFISKKMLPRHEHMSYNRASPLFRFSLLVVLSLGIMVIGHRSELLKPIRIATTMINLPFEFVITLPKKILSVVDDYYPDNSIQQRLVAMRQKQALLEVRLQRSNTLEKENQRLSDLLSISKRFTHAILISKIIAVNPEPFNHRIVVNRGVEAGIYLGQPAIAPQGVLGQVSQVGYRRSVITLLTDPSHGLPVQIERNGLRTIIQGSGKLDQVIVPFLENSSDIRKGDVLVTSGMGGRFPVGYKVAEISDVVKDVSQPFMIITARTTQTALAKEVLLLFNNDPLAASEHADSKRPESSKESATTTSSVANE